MSGYRGSLLAQSSPKSLRAVGAHGRPAWRSHASIQSLINQSIRDQARADRVAAFFASPVLEPDGGAISWYAPVRGPVRPWPALHEDERRRAEGDVSEICRELSALAAAIRSRSSGGGALAEVVEQALRRPADGDSLFLVGDQPVCVWWGFQDQLARADAIAPAAHPPLPQWPQMAEDRRPEPPVEPKAQPAAVTVASVLPAPATGGASGIWNWLRWVLLAIALLLLILLLLRGCQNMPGLLASDPPKPGLDPPRPAEGAVPRPAVVPPASAGRSLDPAPSAPGGVEGLNPALPASGPGDRSVTLSEGERVQLAPAASGGLMTVTLEWSTAVDLDLWAFFRRPDGSRGQVFFASKLSQGIELDNDAGVDAQSGRHREVITVSDLPAFSEVLFVANIFDSDLLKNLLQTGPSGRSFSEFDGKVTLRTSAREEVSVALTANDKAPWFVIAKLVNAGGKVEVRNVNRVSRRPPRVEDY